MSKLTMAFIIGGSVAAATFGVDMIMRFIPGLAERPMMASLIRIFLFGTVAGLVFAFLR